MRSCSRALPSSDYAPTELPVWPVAQGPSSARALTPPPRPRSRVRRRLVVNPAHRCTSPAPRGGGVWVPDFGDISGRRWPAVSQGVSPLCGVSPNASFFTPNSVLLFTGESFAGSRSSWSAAQVSAPISMRCHERHSSQPGVWVAQFHRMRCASCLSEVVALKCWSAPRRCSITTARPSMKID